MRRLLLYLSEQKQLRHWAETSALAKRLSSRFVAGETLAQALDLSRRVNREGFLMTVDYLGESVTSLAEAAAARDVYLDALTKISAQQLNGNVSIKLTQFGMDVAEEACRDNVELLVRKAAELENFVRVDMESSRYTDRTLRLVTDLHARYGAVGTVIQAYLYRSEKDVEMLCQRGIRVRLCKGAYLEPPGVAFQRKADVDTNFVRLMKLLLSSGTYPAIATHDEKIVEQTKAFARTSQISQDRFEFQMLYGIRRDIQRQLLTEGYRVRLYIPFGEAWYPYFMRRLAERPANLLFVARNLLRA